MAAICPNTQIEFDLLRRVPHHIVHAHDPPVEIHRLCLVLREEPDVRDEERLFHELLIQERAAYRIDRLFGESNGR